MLECLRKKKGFITTNKYLEKKDKKLIWRNRVNEELKKSYKKIFSLIDDIIFLKVRVLNMFINGDFFKKKININYKRKKTMNDIQIKNFIMFYERLTRHMLKSLGKKANFLIKIDNDHRLKSIKFN